MANRFRQNQCDPDNGQVTDSINSRHTSENISTDFHKQEAKYHHKKLIKPISNPNKEETDKLPVHAHKNEFFRLLNESQSVIVCGETGSGKTTQIPQWCLEYAKRKMKAGHVACTQPRRIAAMSVASRVACERGCELGKEVGYEVRFESMSSAQTKIVYLTDGMLMREATFKKDLPRYSIIILDEAHERTLQTEILFGVIKRALTKRNSVATIKEAGDDSQSIRPLKVVIMSATINTRLFEKFFAGPTLAIEGRQYAVQNMTTEVPQSDLLQSTLTTVFQVHRNYEPGDILVFCSGQDEIQTLVILTKKALKFAASQPNLKDDSILNLIPLPLYASLPASQQMMVFDRDVQVAMKMGNSLPNGKHKKRASDDDSDSDDMLPPKASAKVFFDKIRSYRRVIYATNVAETSVTIPNIKYVIDTGKVKCRNYCPRTGLESLKVTTISKAQAKQRSGRAGRTSPGICFRLYTADDYDKMEPHLAPEIKRCNLDSVLLQLIAIDGKCIKEFEFLDRPDDDRLKAALRNLLSLKAIIPSSSKSNHCNQNGIDTNGNSSSSITTPSSSNTSDSDLGRLEQTTTQDKVTPATLADDNVLLNLSYDLTTLGNKLRRLPLHPAMSRIIIAANDLGCLDEALTVVSLLSIENLFHIPPSKQAKAEEILSKFYSNEGDAVMLLNVFRAFRRTSVLNRKGLKQWCLEHFIHIKNLKLARLIRRQLLQITKAQFGMQSSSCSQDTSVLRRALTYGLFNNVATMWDGKYRNKNSSKEIFIHPSSCLFRVRPECILYAEVVETNKSYMRNCTLIDSSWVREVYALPLSTS